MPLLMAAADAQQAPPARPRAPAQALPAQAQAQAPIPSEIDRLRADLNALRAQLAAPPIPAVPMPTVELEQLLDLVTASSGKQFLLDARVNRTVHVRGDDVPATLTYPTLLSILRNNGYAGVEIEGFVNIIPMGLIRQYPTPMVQENERDRPADEYVTTIIELQNVEAPILVPLLRVLIPVEGHLAATPTKLIVLDRYANIRRIIEIVKELDR
jgi:general secretion pathway protein D